MKATSQMIQPALPPLILVANVFQKPPLNFLP